MQRRNATIVERLGPLVDAAGPHEGCIQIGDRLLAIGRIRKAFRSVEEAVGGLRHFQQTRVTLVLGDAGPHGDHQVTFFGSEANRLWETLKSKGFAIP